MGIAPGFCATLFRDVWWGSTGLTILYCDKAPIHLFVTLLFRRLSDLSAILNRTCLWFFFSAVPGECWENVNLSSEFLSSLCISSFITCYVTFSLERVSSNNQWFIKIKLEFNFNAYSKILQWITRKPEFHFLLFSSGITFFRRHFWLKYMLALQLCVIIKTFFHNRFNRKMLGGFM
jgi:hypothetical protein